MEYRKLTEKIIGCAYHVYNRMEFGFIESVYPVNQNVYKANRMFGG